jgi:hypothetical protein
MEQKEFTLEKVRHIPRNQYKHCDVNPLMRYLYKYNFDKYCIRFEVRDRELHGPSVRFDNILDCINHLVSVSNELGIPIAREGLICYYNYTDSDDPYFVCKITLDYMGVTIKPRGRDFEVYSVEP